MANASSNHSLAASSLQSNGQITATTVATPTEDKRGARVKVPPRSVIPVIFLPGIMGSNLRLKPERQNPLSKKNNIAWRPDRKSFLLSVSQASAAERQRLLHPDFTEVDLYDPGKEAPGAGETADKRHDNVKIDCESPWLQDDPKSMPNARSAIQKARARGWGEVMFDSYGNLLNRLEDALHNVLREGIPQSYWPELLGNSPQEWGRLREFPNQALSAEALKRLAKVWFPVHAMGYNWLKSNADSGKALVPRINRLMQYYRERNFRCDKVILVTHSMGGLVARALVHPKYGNFSDKVLGIVHGVMPTLGAPAAYKRMKAGFEGLASQVLGKDGEQVTAVLAHSPGGLELLPSSEYGNGWLKITDAAGKTLKALPQHGDPYGEIYQQAGPWWALINPRWVNPAGVSEASALLPIFERLNAVKTFHSDLYGFFHTQTLATFGADPKRESFGLVEWRLQGKGNTSSPDTLKVHKDSGGGKIVFVTGPVSPAPFYNPWGGGGTELSAEIQPPAAPGDETVPLHSAQAVKGGALLQTGYDHQGSYNHNKAQHATLYAITHLALQWEGLAK